MKRIVLLTKKHSICLRLIGEIELVGTTVVYTQSWEKLNELCIDESVAAVLLDALSFTLDQIEDYLLQLRSDFPQKLSMVFSQHCSTSDKLRFLAAGCDDLCDATTSATELKLRLQNLLTKERLQVRDSYEIGIGIFFPNEGVLRLPAKTITLRKKETALLECLAKYHYRVLARAEIARHLWPNPDSYPSLETLDVYVRRLRMKLGEQGKCIKTYRGFGYRWEPQI